MSFYHRWVFPELPAEVADLFQQNEQKLVVVGVIGKSAFADANKMVLLNVLNQHQLLMEDEPKEGRISFYFNPDESMLLLHFETTFDAFCLQKFMTEQLAQKNLGQFLQFNQLLRSRFARMLLFAQQICHIIVFVEVGANFDTSLLSIFKAIKIIREKHVLKFLPKLIKNSNIGAWLGKLARLCTPRFICLFENYPTGLDKSKQKVAELEAAVEENIFKMFRNEFIQTNNASSLFNLPKSKQFVYFNIDAEHRQDPLVKSVKILNSLLHKQNIKEDLLDDLDTLLPYKGFGKPLPKNEPINNMDIEERQFKTLLQQHVKEALDTGFDEGSSSKHKRQHITLLSAKDWYETFRLLYKIFIENPDKPDFEAKDADYKTYLESFNRIVNIDDDFFSTCCEVALKKAYNLYNNPTLTHYNAKMHENMMNEAIALYKKYARGTQLAQGEAELRQMCYDCWQNGRQQCCFRSLRGNECIMPLHVPSKDFTEHSSGHVFISTCNCGRTQGRREDPYSIRDANYEFYEYMAKNCNLCQKVKKIHFAVFEPSIHDFRAADVETAFPKLTDKRTASKNYKQHCILTASSTSSGERSQLQQDIVSQGGLQTNLSLTNDDNFNKLVSRNRAQDDEDEDDINSSEDDNCVNELVLQVQQKFVKQTAEELDKERSMVRQPSTTEYLPGMVHTESPLGLLPQFPSWSLICVGPSSVYSHNTGLLEHFQSGFLSGSNFLLPWDVHVRLEHANAWSAPAYEKSRYRKIGPVLILKIFVGYEYECQRGHRFIMSSPDKVLRGGTGILRDSGSKVVYNNMPLYFPCPCRSQKSNVAQLMRVHVVTPKAPVNVIVNPKVFTGDYTFTLGLPQPPKLTQSAYWILRLPYVYQGDEEPILPPAEITAQAADSHGYLMAGMFGVSETEVDEL